MDKLNFSLNKINTKDEKNKINKIICISLVFTGSLVGLPTLYNIIQLEKFNQTDLTLMNKNFFGVPYTIISPNENIMVSISKNFTEEEQTKIVKAVNDLDILAEGLNFSCEITDDTSSKKIVVKEEILESSSVNIIPLAKTTTTRNELTAKLYYPMNVSINANFNDISILEEIVKHELLHTLGFKDVREDNLKNKTIMFWNICENADDLTQLDIDTLNAIYPK